VALARAGQHLSQPVGRAAIEAVQLGDFLNQDQI
jgi:hypothetical protein